MLNISGLSPVKKTISYFLLFEYSNTFNYELCCQGIYRNLEGKFMTFKLKMIVHFLNEI